MHDPNPLQVTSRAARRGALALLAVVAACARGERGGAEADARAFVESRWRQHFREGQGFSVETLRARRAWFTPRLYALMLADMDAPAGEVGTIDEDPFTGAQDDAERFVVGGARRSHDTVFVDVDVLFDSTTGGGHEHGRVVAVVVPARAGWQIADLASSTGDLVTRLTRAGAGATPESEP